MRDELVSALDLDLKEPGEDMSLASNIKMTREVIDGKGILYALAPAVGNISSATKLLGTSRPTLYDLLK